jgi:hypothetical protein
MIRIAAAALSALMISSSAFAVEFEANNDGLIEFNMPSGNVGCVYVPEGGTATYEPRDGGPELACDRVEPSYVRVILDSAGRAIRLNNVGDASCCGADNIFKYGQVWQEGPFKCISAASGLTCTRGAHGFSLSRKSVKTY